MQSTSFNRKLIGGTTFLYEVSDLDYTGTTVSADEATKKVDEGTKKVESVDKVKKEPSKKKVESKKKSSHSTKTHSESSEHTLDKTKKASSKSRKADETKIDAAIISGDFESKLPPLPTKDEDTITKKVTRRGTKKPNPHDENAYDAYTAMKMAYEIITGVEESKLTSKGKKYMKDIRELAAKLVDKE